MPRARKTALSPGEDLADKLRQHGAAPTSYLPDRVAKILGVSGGVSGGRAVRGPTMNLMLTLPMSTVQKLDALCGKLGLRRSRQVEMLIEAESMKLK